MSLPIKDSFASCLQSDSKGTHIYLEEVDGVPVEMPL